MKVRSWAHLERYLCACLIGALSATQAWAQPFAYITNAGSNNVSVIDTATNTVVGAPIPVGTDPGGGAVNPAGTRVYVANFGSNDVSVIDTATNTVVGAPIAVGTQPAGIAVIPAGTRVYVANFGSNSVSVIDTATNAVVGAPIPVPGGVQPFGIAVNPAGTRVYVTNFGSNNVSVIDTATNTVVGAPIPVGTSPRGIAINSAGTRVYVANPGSNNVSVIDTAADAVVGAPIAVGTMPQGVAVNPAGTRVYVTNSGSNNVWVIDTATNTVVGAPIPLPGGALPIGIAVNPYGTKLYVANFGTNSVSVVDTATNLQVVAPIAVGTSPRARGQFIGPAPAATPPYFVRIDVPPATPPDCNADSVFFSGTGTYSFSLPWPPKNIVYLNTVNGVALPPDSEDTEPIAATVVDTLNISPLGSPAVPYTVVLQIFPGTHGTPVGTGLQISVRCNALGAGQGVATFSVVQAPSAAAIPATSTQALIALVLLLVVAAMWQIRKERA